MAGDHPHILRHRFAHRRNLTLMFDAAHAFGCSYRGRMIGNFGSAEVFSFHATKSFNTFEGGAIVTNDDGLAAKIRLMKNFGFCGYDDIEYIGTNGKMTEVAAAMGLTGLESLDEFVECNRRNYQQYKRELGGLPGVRLLAWNESERCNYQYIVIEVEEQLTEMGRDQLIQALHAENILAPLFLSGLSPDGAIPVVLPACRIAAIGNRAGGAQSHGSAHRKRHRRGGKFRHLPRNMAGHGERARSEPCFG
jgi:dTDP-4-amino-4,6-dideoxygalactose transaminase